MIVLLQLAWGLKMRGSGLWFRSRIVNPKENDMQQHHDFRLISCSNIYWMLYFDVSILARQTTFVFTLHNCNFAFVLVILHFSALPFYPVARNTRGDGAINSWFRVTKHRVTYVNTYLSLIISSLSFW